MQAAIHGKAVASVVCDVSVKADVQAAVKMCVDTYGCIDILVSNAGVYGILRCVIPPTSPAIPRTAQTAPMLFFLEMSTRSE